MQVQYSKRLGSKPPRYPNRIREYRLKAGLSQQALGQLLCAGRGTISGWERGQKLPSLPNAFRLARALDTLAEAIYMPLYSAASLTRIKDDPAPIT
ncbi:MAG: helix-turn-helix domain-containing protein [Candidatus Eisenbacteria bacterium]